MKELITKQTKEVFEAVCNSCGKKIQGSTKNEVVYNLAIHKNSSVCKKLRLEKRIRDALPPTTPGYISPKSNKTKEVKE